MEELNRESCEETETQTDATFGDRLFAAIIDLLFINGLLRMLLIPIVGGINANTSGTLIQHLIGAVIIVLIQFFVYLGYFAVFAFYRNGQTLGKKLLKIKVVNAEGGELTLNQFLVRELVARGVITLGPLFIGKLANGWYLTYLRALSKDNKAVHDLAAKTKVIKLN